MYYRDYGGHAVCSSVYALRCSDLDTAGFCGNTLVDHEQRIISRYYERWYRRYERFHVYRTLGDDNVYPYCNR